MNCDSKENVAFLYTKKNGYYYGCVLTSNVLISCRTLSIIMQKKRLEYASGIALGALVGVIIGLSVSHVVGIFLAALTSLLATFFGLTSKDETESPRTRIDPKPPTIISFGISTILFLALGIYMRTHNVLSPSIASEKADLLECGLSKEEAAKVLVLHRYGITVNDTVHIDPNAKEHPDFGTSLFATTVESADSLINAGASYKELSKALDEGPQSLRELHSTIEYYVTDSVSRKDMLKAVLKSLKEAQQ